MLLSEQLVGQARQRRLRRMSRRERVVSYVSALAFAAVAVGFALILPDERSADPLLTAGLLAAYAIVDTRPLRVRRLLRLAGAACSWFRPSFSSRSRMVAGFVAVAGVLSMLPDVLDAGWHRDRLVGCFADSWFCVGPIVVLALFAPGEASLAYVEIYALALAAQLASDLAWTLLRNELLDGLPLREILSTSLSAARIDCILSPVALMFAVAAVEHPWTLAALMPLIWMLEIFARDRQERYASALELQRAYRGTVTLLSDVVEFDDPYTAAHSRSIVELAEATAEELGIPREERQRIEFAALLHDIGKITIPKEILNKPASLTEEEFDVMKTHTIEGQFMLDRVGGLLGEIGEVVRSCHERWDGSGYPDGLSGEDIPLAARIVFACDAYNAMTTDRVYRSALPSEEAIEELLRHAGTQFDPTVVSALVKVVEEGEPVVTATGDEIRAILSQNAAAAQARVGVTL